MSSERSFREIFFEQLGQKSALSDVNHPFFDPTVTELTPPNLPRYQFSSNEKQRLYTSISQKKSDSKAHREARHTPRTLKGADVRPPTVTRPERRLESQMAFSPQQKASLQVIEDHLGNGSLLPLTESAFKRLYRLTMKRCHPDQGGDARTFVRVRQAFKELERAFPAREA